MIITKDQVVIVRRVLDALHRMRTHQLTHENQELTDRNKLITSTGQLSEKAFLCVKFIEDVLLTNQDGKLIKKGPWSETITSMETFVQWAEQVSWLISIMEGYKPDIY
ncbi:MAG: hypothetical protein WCT16_00575 [Candidatus Buchananbacteria bacterium]